MKFRACSQSANYLVNLSTFIVTWGVLGWQCFDFHCCHTEMLANSKHMVIFTRFTSRQVFYSVGRWSQEYEACMWACAHTLVQTRAQTRGVVVPTEWQAPERTKQPCQAVCHCSFMCSWFMNFWLCPRWHCGNTFKITFLSFSSTRTDTHTPTH